MTADRDDVHRTEGGRADDVPPAGTPTGPTVLAASWLGSTNLGDELIFRALQRQLAQRGATAVGVSSDPAATRVTHGVPAVGHLDVAGWWREAGVSGRMVFGGGGLLQDESSRLNVPYHLARLAVGRARRARVVAVGLGGGTLHRPSRAMVRAALAGVPVGARDRATAGQLRGLGLRDVRLTADLALSLPRPEVAVRDELVVSLRPRTVGGGWRPAGASWRDGLPNDAQLTALGRRFGDLARSLGLSLRFVALQADRDGPLHDQIADRVAGGVPVVTVRPDLDTVLDEIGRGRVVVAMRFHAAVAGLLAGRPVLASAYSSKVAELAADAPRTVHLLGVPLTRVESSHAEQALRVGDHHRASELAALARRELGNGELLDALVDGAGG